jgi:ketosteroid isomerase-like protein
MLLPPAEGGLLNLKELEKRVRVIEDIEAIKNLHREYVFLLINHQFKEMVDCFADDAVAAIAEHTPCKGKKAIEDLLVNVIAKQLGWDVGHFVTQPVIHVKGDKAEGHWLMFLHFPEKPDGPPFKWRQTRYDCGYVRVGGKWKFSSVKFTAPWPAPPQG